MFRFLATLVLPALALGASQVILSDQTNTNEQLADVKVPVQLGVMSKCPDALFCESVFDVVRGEVKEKIDLSFVYIAKLDNSDPDFGVTCLHGPEECAGNVQQLCVAKYATRDQWWDFIQCQDLGGRESIGKPEVALKCAQISQIDWKTSGAGACAGLDGSGRGDEGVKLLQDSVRVVQQLEITKSCTVVINGNKVCVRDGTWKDCENGYTVDDFVRQINDAYDELNSIKT